MYLLVGLVSVLAELSGSQGGEGVNPFAGLRIPALSVFVVGICALASGAAVGMKTAKSRRFRGPLTNLVLGAFVGVAVAAVQFSVLSLWSVFFLFLAVISLGSMGIL